MANAHQIGRPPNGQRLSVRIDAQEFAIDVENVRELRGYTTLTPRPQSPSYVLGLLDLRGTVIPVIDLALRLGMPALKPTPMSVIVVLDSPHGLFGLLVDEVCDLLSANEDAIDLRNHSGLPSRERFITGAMALPSGIVNLLDTQNMFEVGSVA